MPNDPQDVRLSGNTGSGHQTVKTTRLTHFGHRQPATILFLEAPERLPSVELGQLHYRILIAGTGMRRREFVGVLGGAATAWPLVARSQQTVKPRIGFLSSAVQTYQDAFRDEMRALGYMDGKNIVIVYRFADGNDGMLPALAEQLVAAGVDIIVATNSATTRAAIEATPSLPIIMVTSGDPIGSGFIKSFAHPGGNVTGLSTFTTELARKQLEVLIELDPHVTRIATLWNSANDSNIAFLDNWRDHPILQATLQPFDVRSLDDLEAAFQAIEREHFEGLLVLIDQFTISQRKRIVNFANESKIPAVYPLREFILAGGLVSYGTSISDLYRRAADYVDKILKGSKPSDLPVELPTKFELVLNVKAAKALNLAVPVSVLVRADEVIE
jgi:putative tryptophan/tyrosine transport system substrate-binding protein